MYEELKKQAAARNQSLNEYLDYLGEFHEMKHLDDVITQLRKAENAGFSLRQIVHLSVLYTVLKQYSREYPL